MQLDIMQTQTWFPKFRDQGVIHMLLELKNYKKRITGRFNEIVDR